MGKSNHDVYLQKMTEVELIVEELESIHVAGHYTPEQIRGWAHMLQMKKHDSYQDPPKKPFLKSNSKAHNLDDKSSDGLSPGKRIQYRSECIN